MPGTPTLELMVWTSFKAACHKTASPALSEASLQTPGIDRLLSLLNGSKTWTRTKMFAKAKDQMATDEEQALQGIDIPDAPKKSKRAVKMIKELSASVDYLNRLNSAFGAYQPLQDGDGGKVHDEMLPVAKTFATLARASAKIATNNLEVLEKYPHIVAKKKTKKKKKKKSASV